MNPFGFLMANEWEIFWQKKNSVQKKGSKVIENHFVPCFFNLQSKKSKVEKKVKLYLYTLLKLTKYSFLLYVRYVFKRF